MPDFQRLIKLNVKHALALTKSGTGSLTLTGTNTYTGGTTISAGTLQLGNAGSDRQHCGQRSPITGYCSLIVPTRP